MSKAQSATLSFTHIINYAVDMQVEQTLWVSTNYVQGTNPTTAAWTQLSAFTYPDGNSWDKAESGEISIPTKFLKDNVSFAFKYTSTTSGSATGNVTGEEATICGSTTTGASAGTARSTLTVGCTSDSGAGTATSGVVATGSGAGATSETTSTG